MRSRACFALLAAAMLVLASGVARPAAAQEFDAYSLTQEQIASLTPEQLQTLRVLQAQQDEAAALQAAQQASAAADLNGLRLESALADPNDAAAAQQQQAIRDSPSGGNGNNNGFLGGLFGSQPEGSSTNEVLTVPVPNLVSVSERMPAEPVPQPLPAPVAAAPTPAPSPTPPAPAAAQTPMLEKAPAPAPAPAAAPAPAPAPAKAPAPAPAKGPAPAPAQAKAPVPAPAKQNATNPAANATAAAAPANGTATATVAPTGDVMAAYGLVVPPDAAKPVSDASVELPSASGNPKMSYIALPVDAIGVRAMIAKGKHNEVNSNTLAALHARPAAAQATPKKLTAAKSDAEAPAVKRGGSLAAALLTVFAIFAVSLL